MADHQALIRDVSDTALWTAAYRADESERKDALFCDPFARRLAGERGAEIAARVKGKATRTGVVLRTAVFDEVISGALATGRFDTVLALAAGLDVRPYRLELPAGLRWIEVDMPALLEYKAQLLAAETPRCDVERIGLDLADEEARRALFGRIAEQSAGVLVFSEGLLTYLEPTEVASLSEDMAAHATFGEWATDITGHQVVEAVRDAGKEFKAGNARVKFAPEENTGFFLPHGWKEREYFDLFAEAPRLGRDTVLARMLRGAIRFLPERRRRFFERGVGVAVLEQA